MIVKSKDLIKGIQSVIYARSKDKDLKDKPLSGICISLRYNKLNLVASNGHRLAIYTIPTDASEKIDAVISEKTAKEILKNIKKKENVEIEIGNNLVINGLEYSLIHNKYPNYESIYPEDGFSIEIVVPKEEILEAIENVVKVRPRKGEWGKYDVIKLTLFNDYNKLIIAARNHIDDSYNSVEIDIDIKFNHISHEDFIIYFNDRYVQEAIKPIDSSNVIVRFLKVYNETSQTEFTAENSPYSSIVMPMTGWM